MLEAKILRKISTPMSKPQQNRGLQLPLSSCVVRKKFVQVTPACITITDKIEDC